MCNSRIIQFRVSETQYQRIQNRKQAMGYLQLSVFLRDLLLRDDLATYVLIKEIHNKIVLGSVKNGKIKNCL